MPVVTKFLSAACKLIYYMCLLNICTWRYYQYFSFYISKLILFSFLISVVYFIVNEPIASAFWLSQSPRVFLKSLSCRILFSTNCWLDREGYGNPLQHACLENPVDRGAWWAAVHGVTELDMTEMTWHACMHWRRKWQPMPVLLPVESQGQRSLVGCCPWGRTESDTTEVT